MLIFINLILYIFICSLQSITKNVYGIEDPSNKIFRLEQLEPINNEDEQKLIIDRKKRHIGSGFGDGGGDGGGGCGCTPGQTGVSCGCGCCESPSMKRPRPRNYWRRPYVRKLYRRPHYIRRRPYWWRRRYLVIEY
uniref:Candidate secreted effector n=1 Tax=Meloidogyne incognita TaxID=6306 RepID=A0A914KHB3_MELIC